MKRANLTLAEAVRPWARSVRIDRFQAFSVGLSVLLFSAVTVFFGMWRSIADFSPSGVDSELELMSIGSKSIDGKTEGIPSTLLEQIGHLPGISAAYASRPTQFHVSFGDASRLVGAAFVSRGFFDALGVPVLGSGFSDVEELSSIDRYECVISQALNHDMGGEVGLLGRLVVLKGETCMVVGVVTNSFAGLRNSRKEDVWLNWPSVYGLIVPRVAPPDFVDRAVTGRDAGVRLDGTRSRKSVERDIGALTSRPDMPELTITLYDGEGVDPVARADALQQVSLLWLAAFNFLVIGLVFLGVSAAWRTERRRSQVAIRSALGASAAQLTWASIRSALRVALISLVIGLPIAFAIYRSLASLPAFDAVRALLPAWPQPAAIAAAFVTLAMIALMTGATDIRGVRRAVRQRNTGLQVAMQRASRGESLERATVAFIVVAATIATCLALGLWREQVSLSSKDLGYRVNELHFAALRPAASLDEVLQFAPPDARPTALRQDLDALFGKGMSTLASSLPFRTTRNTAPIQKPSVTDVNASTQVNINYVDQNFFGLLGIAVLEGNSFTSPDLDEVVVSRLAALRYLGEPPWVGQKLRFQNAGGVEERRVIGVVADVAYAGPDVSAEPFVYRPLTSLSRLSAVAFAPRPGADPTSAIRNTLSTHGIRAPLFPIESLAELSKQNLAADRVRSFAGIGGSVLGVMLCALGLAAVVSTLMMRRLRDLALRSAVGASSLQLWGSLTSRMLTVATIGSVVGGALYLSLMEIFASRFGMGSIAPIDAMVGSSIVVSACLAATLPAWVLLQRLDTARLLSAD